MQQSKERSVIGERIAAVSQRHNLTLYRVAKNAGMDHSQFHRMLRKVSPTRESLLRICRAIGCTQSEAEEIFAVTGYRAPTDEELREEEKPAA